MLIVQQDKSGKRRECNKLASGSLMIYIGFLYGYVLFCSMKDKRNTKHLTFQLVFFVLLFPTNVLRSRERRKVWTQDKRRWKLIWRGIWTELFYRVPNATFSISNSGTKLRKKSFPLHLEMSQPLWSLLCQCSKTVRHFKLTAAQVNIQTLFDWWDLNVWSCTFCFEDEWANGQNRRTFQTQKPDWCHILSILVFRKLRKIPA